MFNDESVASGLGLKPWESADEDSAHSHENEEGSSFSTRQGPSVSSSLGRDKKFSRNFPQRPGAPEPEESRNEMVKPATPKWRQVVPNRGRTLDEDSAFCNLEAATPSVVVGETKMDANMEARSQIGLDQASQSSEEREPEMQIGKDDCNDVDASTEEREVWEKHPQTLMTLKANVVSLDCAAASSPTELLQRSLKPSLHRTKMKHNKEGRRRSNAFTQKSGNWEPRKVIIFGDSAVNNNTSPRIYGLHPSKHQLRPTGELQLGSFAGHQALIMVPKRRTKVLPVRPAGRRRRPTQPHMQTNGRQSLMQASHSPVSMRKTRPFQSGAEGHGNFLFVGSTPAPHSTTERRRDEVKTGRRREQKPQSAQKRRHNHPKMNCERSHAGASVMGSVRLPNVYSLEVAAPEIWRRRNMKKKPDVPLSQPQNLEQVMVQRYSFTEEQSANFVHLCSQMAILDSKH